MSMSVLFSKGVCVVGGGVVYIVPWPGLVALTKRKVTMGGGGGQWR